LEVRLAPNFRNAAGAELPEAGAELPEAVAELPDAVGTADTIRSAG
jgi:hypothetical protein